MRITEAYLNYWQPEGWHHYCHFVRLENAKLEHQNLNMLWFVYNMFMFSLTLMGTLFILKAAYSAAKRGLKYSELIQAIVCVCVFGLAIAYWANGTPQLFVETPRWYCAFACFMITGGSYTYALYALDPILAKKLMNLTEIK